MLAVLIGGGLWLMFAPRDQRRRHWRPALLTATLFGIAAIRSIAGQVSQQTIGSHDSLTQRLEVETATRALWQSNFFTGVGLRYFDLPAFMGYQPPNNVFNEILAEAGLPGLIGFIVFLVSSLVALKRCSGPLALAGFTVVFARFAHGFVDIYWTAGTTTLVWLIGGMGLAATGMNSVNTSTRRPAVADAPTPA
jgi:O-antigen ligase